MIFIGNINVVLLVAQFYSFSHQQACFQLRSHKKGFQGFLPLRSSSKAITQCTIRTLEMGLYTPM